MDIKELTPEQRAELKAQLEAEEKAERTRIEQERKSYKELVDVTIASCVGKLTQLSSQMEKLKEEVFKEFDSVVKMQEELFKVKLDRQTKTYTTTDGRTSITIGNRVNDGWDDTVEVGITQVKEYLSTMAKDENSANLVDTVMSLLSKNRRGELKASKVLELDKLARKTGDKAFIEAIGIIREAYRPAPTCQFISVELTNEKDGKKYNLPLSMSAI